MFAFVITTSMQVCFLCSWLYLWGEDCTKSSCWSKFSTL